MSVFGYFPLYNHDKCKIIVNGEGPTPMIYMYDMQIKNVEHFKYLGAMLTNSGNSKIEIRIRLATAVSALVKLENIWHSGEIEFKLKFRLYNSLVLKTLLYVCETWTLLEEEDPKLLVKSFYHRRFLNISYKERKTNILVNNLIN